MTSDIEDAITQIRDNILTASFGGTTITATQIFGPGSAGYIDGVRHWLISSTDTTTAYVVQPGTPEDVSVIMKAIAEYKVPFAVKCAGHITVPGMSSTPGIQIYLGRLNAKQYHEGDQTFEVGAGTLLDDAYRRITQYGRNIVAGDIHKGVGLGGYLLGGGFSLKTNQFGLGIDNIVEIKGVLPNGTPFVANEQDEPDLFWALKGGGNNFGVVTSFKLKTHPQGLVYATAHFAAKSKDKKTAIETAIVFQRNDSGGVDGTIVTSCFHDGPKPDSDPFAAFEAIPHTGELAEHPFITLSEKIGGARAGKVRMDDAAKTPTEETIYANGRWGCVMVRRYNQRLIRAVMEQAKKSSRMILSKRGSVVRWNLWPFLPTIYNGRQDKDAAWPHKQGKPYAPLIAQYQWEVTASDVDWVREMKRALGVIRGVAFHSHLTESTAPVYLNTTLPNTTVEKIYQGNLGKLKKLRAKYDPDGVMNHTGGFRIEPEQGQLTNAASQKPHGKQTRALPTALARAAAQRQDPETKVAAIVDIGREGNWSGLGSATRLEGRTLEECLSVIHSDIVTIWNIQDDLSYLDGDDFKARLSYLAEDLVNVDQRELRAQDTPESNTMATFASATANPIATIGAVAEPAKWVYDTYQLTPSCISCVMGYVVDLVLVLCFLSEMQQFQESTFHTIEEDAVNAIEAYINSDILAQIHKDIREFVGENPPGEVGDGRDVVFGKIEQLVKKFHQHAEEVANAYVSRMLSSPMTSESVMTISDEDVESYSGEDGVPSSEPGRLSPSPGCSAQIDSVQESTG